MRSGLAMYLGQVLTRTPCPFLDAHRSIIPCRFLAHKHSCHRHALTCSTPASDDTHRGSGTSRVWFQICVNSPAIGTVAATTRLPHRSAWQVFARATAVEIMLGPGVRARFAMYRHATGVPPALRAAGLDSLAPEGRTPASSSRLTVTSSHQADEGMRNVPISNPLCLHPHASCSPSIEALGLSATAPFPALWCPRGFCTQTLFVHPLPLDSHLRPFVRQVFLVLKSEGWQPRAPCCWVPTT